jgi:hypothetical protein
MATINPTITRNGDHSILKFTFEGITTTNTVGAAVPFAEFADRTIQLVGTFGAAATVVWEGSNNGVDFATLTDPQGNSISKTSAGIETIMEITEWARPRLASGGDGSTDIDVILLCRRQNPMRT